MPVREMSFIRIRQDEMGNDNYEIGDASLKEISKKVLYDVGKMYLVKIPTSALSGI